MSLLTKGIKITQTPTKDGSRYLGGAIDRGAADHPMLTGNFYVFFGLPSAIFGSDSNTSAAAVQGTLLTAAEEFTPHADAQVKIIDADGQGGVGSSFISGKSITREFSITYKDFWDAPIFRIHRKWSFINPYFGASDIAHDYSASEYKGVCMVIRTKPVVRKGNWSLEDIIKIDYYNGVFPKVDLSSVYSATINDNQLVRPQVTYSFDGFPLCETDDNVLKAAVEILNQQEIFRSIEDSYSKLTSDQSTRGSGLVKAQTSGDRGNQTKSV